MFTVFQLTRFIQQNKQKYYSEQVCEVLVGSGSEHSKKHYYPFDLSIKVLKRLTIKVFLITVIKRGSKKGMRDLKGKGDYV